MESSAAAGAVRRGGGAASEVGWIDVGRGLMVITIVVVHLGVVLAHQGAVNQALLEPLAASAWFRLPLLFLLSGALFRNYGRRPWRVVLRNRVLLFAWVLVVWLTLDELVDLWLDEEATIDPASVLGPVLANVVAPNTYLWFIWSLVAVVVVTRLLARASWALVALAVTAITGLLPLDALPVAWNLQNTVPYFLVGFVVSPLVLRHGHRIGFLATVTGGLALAAVWIFVYEPRLLQGHVAVGVEVLVLVIPAVPLVVGLSRLLSRVPGGVLELVGRRTLPVYVMHLPLALVLGELVEEIAPHLLADAPYVLTWSLAAVCVVVPMVLWWALDRLGLHGVFDVPVVVLRLVDRVWPPTGERGPRLPGGGQGARRASRTSRHDEGKVTVLGDEAGGGAGRVTGGPASPTR